MNKEPAPVESDDVFRVELASKALREVGEALRPLSTEERKRVLAAVAVLFGVEAQ